MWVKVRSVIPVFGVLSTGIWGKGAFSNILRAYRLLGKGAFGEVYYGLLADVSRLRKDLPIAVKVYTVINNVNLS